MDVVIPWPLRDRPRPLGLGLDTGGTHTRWALSDGEGVLADGEFDGFSAVQLQHSVGRDGVEHLLDWVAREAGRHGQVGAACAGVTGLGDASEPAGQSLTAMLSQSLQIPAHRIELMSDIALAYRSVFQPGEGYVICAGTGSIAAYIDGSGHMHRVGGRGGVLDDGGSGFWIAREALKRVWREEDARPGSWRESPMARALFDRIGSSEWAATRAFVYGGDRGDVGRLALAVAAAAEVDAAARELLHEAGLELARLGLALHRRFGCKPWALKGRVQALHPSISETLRAAMPPGAPWRETNLLPQHVAAERAARTLVSA